MTEGSDEPDFQVGGFEWSLRVSGDAVGQVPASVMPRKSAETARRYSFAEDWRALGFLAANCLDAEVLPSGNVAPRAGSPSSIVLQPPEQIFLKRLSRLGAWTNSTQIRSAAPWTTSSPISVSSQLPTQAVSS